MEYTVKELRSDARKANIPGRSSMNKAELISALKGRRKGSRKGRRGSLLSKKDSKDFFEMIWTSDHNRREMYANLREFKKVMKEIDMFFWIGEGTALGAIREGGIIPGDTDIDVGVYYEDRRRFISDAIPKLRENGFRVGRVYPLSIFRDDNYIDIDFTGVGKRCMAIEWPRKCDTFISTLEPFSTAKLKGVTYVVPSLRYIEKLYGKTWRIPQDIKPSDIQ
jgi:hypothetical protein